MSRLEAEGVAVALGGRPILAGVSLALGAGELVGLIGPNGAGKTTLLRVLGNLATPDRGTVRVAGRPLGAWKLGALAREIAYLAQGSLVHWPLRVERLVALGRLPHRRGWAGESAADRAAVARAMAAADVGTLADREVGTLSGGERMRVMLARALAVEAPLLLADEPVAALDPQHQLRVMAVLRDAAAGGAGIMAVLHDLTLASRFCSRLVLLDRGTLVADGTPAEVLTDANIERAYGVTSLRGVHEGQPYVIPWAGAAPLHPFGPVAPGA